MTIRPVDLNGMIQRTDDVGIIKHQQDAKPMHDQQNIQIQVDNREDQLFHQVNDSSESSKLKNDTDAKNGGNGSYSGGRKKKKEKKTNAKIIDKNAGGGFDIKI